MLARAAADAGYEVHVASPGGDESLHKQLEAAGLIHHHIPINRKGTNPLGGLWSVLSIMRLYLRLKPDIAHHVTLKMVVYGGIAARLTGIKHSVHALAGLGYSFTGNSPRRRVIRGAMLLPLRIALSAPGSRIIFQNPDDLETFVGLGLARKAQCVLIRGSGVDPDIYTAKPEPPLPVHVAFISRMLRDKGLCEFVAAVRLLKPRYPQVSFNLIGDTDPHNPAAVSTEQLNTWHEEGLVNWQGHRTDMTQVFSENHLICLPSYREGLPKVLIEAASCSRAIVTTDTPGCREIVQHEVNGLLVPVGESASLADAIARLIDDPELRQRMGAQGRQRVLETFSLQHVIDSTLAVYRELGAS